jgi:hypothetical protein
MEQHSFQRSIEKVELLGCDEVLHWTHDIDGLTIQAPVNKPGEHAFAFRISPTQ